MSCCGVFVAALVAPEPTVEYSLMFPTVPMITYSWPGRVRQTFRPLYADDWATPHSSFGISNDGGWCRAEFRQSFQRGPFVPDVRVVWPPVRGEAEAVPMAGRVRVAYQPTTGFLGTDHFRVRNNGPIPLGGTVP